MHPVRVFGAIALDEIPGLLQPCFGTENKHDVELPVCAELIDRMSKNGFCAQLIILLRFVWIAHAYTGSASQYSRYYHFGSFRLPVCRQTITC